MPEYQQTKKTSESKYNIQTQTARPKQIPVSNIAAIIQRAKINPKSLTYSDVMQLQCTIGNRAVGILLTGIGNTSPVQQAPVQRQEIPEEEEPLQGKMNEPVQLQDIPEEEEPLQGKMADTIQRQEIPEEEEPLQGNFENKPDKVACPSCFAAPIVQRQEIPEEEEPLQGKMIETVQRKGIPEEEEEPLQTKTENNTGMPDNLKAGVESLSGIDMSDVRVHYNSAKPTEVGALAYTQGTNIHVAPGQEGHLPHEAWHVVQQKQQRVRPTMQLKDVAVNDSVELEQEADVMGVKVMQLQHTIGNRAVGKLLTEIELIPSTAKSFQRPEIPEEKECPSCSETTIQRKKPEFSQYANDKSDELLLETECGKAGIGGICTAMIVDWFSQIINGEKINTNPIKMPEKLSRLIKEQKEYGEIVMNNSRGGMNEYLKTKGMERKIPEGNGGDFMVEGGIDEITGELNQLEFVKLKKGRMYMIDFGDKGGEGVGHTIGLYQQENNIVVRDQNVGQKIVKDMTELSEHYKTVFLNHAEERQSNNMLPLYRKWSLYEVSSNKKWWKFW